MDPSLNAPVWNPKDFPGIPPPPGASPLPPPPTAPPDAGASGPLAPPSFGGSLLRGMESVQSGLGKAAAVPFRLAGKLDVASGIKTPEQAESRAQTYGGITRDVAEASLVPWSKAAGPLGYGLRALQGGALQAAQTPGDVGDRLKGGAIGAGTSLAGDALAGGVRAAGSAVSHKLFSNQSAARIGDWLRQNVPAWSGMKGDRGLYEMAREGGQAKLSDAYAKALAQAADQIPAGTTVNLAADAARRAGFAGAKDVVDAAGNVAVDAARLMSALPNLTKDQATRRLVLDALHTGLPPGSVNDKAMREYALGSGWMDFAKKSGLFNKGESYDASAAQEALRKYGKETLERRGMSEVRDIIRGPLSMDPIKKGSGKNMGTALGSAAGALGGGTGFGVLGGMGGAAGGGYLGGILGQRMPMYKNVPETIPQIGQIRKALLQALTQQVTQGMRSTGE